MMREHDLITQFFAPLTQGEPGSFALRDDAAVLQPPPGKQLVTTTDSVIEGIHLLENAVPEQYAVKLVRRNLSDLAAMGATPWRYLLNMHLNDMADNNWLAAFAEALRDEQERFGMVLVGGDTTRGGEVIHLTMTCLGLLDGKPLRREGAHPGDALYVSGTIGDAALGLELLREGKDDAALSARYWRPEPRLQLGAALRGIANAALDCSDGLVKDTARLCEASGCGAVIERDAVPLSAAAIAQKTHPDFWETVLGGGDDYELIFAAPLTQQKAIATLAEKLALPLTRIGNLVEGESVIVQDRSGNDVTPEHTGWEY